MSALDRVDSHVEMESLEGKLEGYGLDSGKAVADITLNGSIAANSSFKSMPSNGVMESIKIVIFSAKINLLIPFGPAAILVKAFSGHHGWVFFLSLVGIIPLAERLGFATEQLAFFTGPTVGGLLNATFGNATELIISIYALKTGNWNDAGCSTVSIGFYFIKYVTCSGMCIFWWWVGSFPQGTVVQ